MANETQVQTPEAPQTMEQQPAGAGQQTAEAQLASTMAGFDDPLEAFRVAAGGGEASPVAQQTQEVPDSGEDPFPQVTKEQGFAKPAVEVPAQTPEAPVQPPNIEVSHEAEPAGLITELPPTSLETEASPTVEVVSSLMTEAEWNSMDVDALSQVAERIRSGEVTATINPETGNYQFYLTGGETPLELTCTTSQAEYIGINEAADLQVLEQTSGVPQAEAVVVNRQKELTTAVANGLIGRVLRGEVTVSQGHGGLRLIDQNNSEAYSQVYTQSELIDAGVMGANTLRINNPDQAATQAGEVVQQGEVPASSAVSDEDIQQAALLSSFQDDLLRGTYRLEPGGPGIYLFVGEDIPTLEDNPLGGSVLSARQAELSGLLAAQEIADKVATYGAETELQQHNRMMELRDAVSAGLVDNIARGEVKVRQRHHGYEVNGKIYTKSELKQFGVYQIAKEKGLFSVPEEADVPVAANETIQTAKTETPTAEAEGAEPQPEASADTIEQKAEPSTTEALNTKVEAAGEKSRQEQLDLFRDVMTEMMVMMMSGEQGEDGAGERQQRVAGFIEMMMKLLALLLEVNIEASGQASEAAPEVASESESTAEPETAAPVTTPQQPAQQQADPVQHTQPATQTSSTTSTQSIPSTPIVRPSVSSQSSVGGGRPMSKPPENFNTLEPVAPGVYVDNETGNAVVAGDPGSPQQPS